MSKDYKTKCGCLEENSHYGIDYQFSVQHGLRVNINSCCGGGCYCLSNLKYCPFCQIRLEAILE